MASNFSDGCFRKKEHFKIEACEPQIDKINDFKDKKFLMLFLNINLVLL